MSGADDFNEKLLEALDDCKTPEDVEDVLNEFYGDSSKLVTRIITVTRTCKLCGTSTTLKEKVLANSREISQRLDVGNCGFCEVQLLQKSKEELVDLLLNVIRFGNPHPQLVKLRQMCKEARNAREGNHYRNDDGAGNEEESCVFDTGSFESH